MKTIILFSITSDIGLFIAKHYYTKNYKVIGTYRKENSLKNLKNSLPNGSFYKCDASDPSSIDKATREIKKDFKSWDILISCPCTPVPINKFSNCNFNEWEESFYLNSLAQLKFLHSLLEIRNREVTSNFPLVLFFAGGGTNNAVDSFSAYTSAKIHLIKMFEFLAFEDNSTKYTIIGPGWTNTKTHYVTLENSKKNSKKHVDVKNFLKNPSNGTPLIDIVQCIEWIDSQKINTVTGRNFSVVNDAWRGEKKENLIKALDNDFNLYKLRRCGNNLLF